MRSSNRYFAVRRPLLLALGTDVSLPRLAAILYPLGQSQRCWQGRRRAAIMRVISLQRLMGKLETGIRDRRCVQTWLGYGEVLFIGFGEDVIPEPSPGERHQHPPYELQTEFADWRVEEGSKVRGTGDDERDHAQAACELLVGRHATDWLLDVSTFALTVRFEGDFSLVVVPLTDEDVVDDNAWMFVNPAGEYLCVICGGGLYVAPSEGPGPSLVELVPLGHRHEGY
jgi:hypothetical protein